MAAPSSALLRSLLASTVRGWRGTHSVRRSAPTATSLVLFDRENDPDCRLLRELLTELQLDVLIQPCPLGGKRFARRLPRGASLPFLRDSADGNSSSGLNACLRQVLQHVPAATAASALLGSWPMRLSSRFASRLRGDAGLHVRPSRLPRKPLELFSFESSPFSRLVRERLCELQLPWVLRSFGKEQMADWGPPNARFTVKAWQALPGGRREAMLRDTGKAQVPYLIDPNQGIELFESSHILAHLQQHYAR